MLSELVEKIGELAVKAQEPCAFHPESEPNHIYYLVTPGQPPLRCEAEPPPRQHQASDLQAIVAFALDHDQPTDHPEQHTEVWYSRCGVVVFLSAQQRRDKVTLPLSLSGPMGTLQNLEANQGGVGQKDFLKLLRISLSGAVPAGIIASVRNIKFRQLTEAASEIRQGKASIGKSLEAELTGAALLPEDVVLSVPVFHGFLGVKLFGVACALDVDPVTEKFSLVPFPGQIEQAIREAECYLGDLLNQELGEHYEGKGDLDIPVLYGTP